MMQKQVHPCTKFQNGEVRDFYDAMITLREQQEFEMDLGIQITREHIPSEVATEQKNKRIVMAEITKQIAQATQIYEQYVTPAIKQAAETLRATKDPLLKDIADAIESGDYSGLSM